MIILNKEFRYITNKKSNWSKPAFEDSKIVKPDDLFFIEYLDKDNFIDLIYEGLSKSRIVVLLPEKLDQKKFKKSYQKTLSEIPKRRLKSNVSNIKTEYFVIFSSGTTGRPKAVIHSVESISNKIKKRGRSFIWGLTYDPFRMAGLQVIFSAITNGDKLVIGNNNNIKETIDFFLKYNVNSISATPSYLKILLSYKSARKLNLSQVTLGGEIVDQKLLNQTRIVFPKSNITHIYASTEIGSAFSVQDELSGFPSSFLENKNILNGNVIIKDKELCFKSKYGVFKTGDMVFEKKDRIFFAGRKDSLINVGGNKIYLEQIEKTIEECDNVRTASCKAVEHKFLNQIIIATVSLDKADKTSLSIEKRNIRRYCIKMLPKFAVPTKIEFVKNVKLSSNSKMIRKL